MRTILEFIFGFKFRDIIELQKQVEQMELKLAEANNIITDLQASPVMKLNPYVTVTSDNRGPLVKLSGLNLQVNNGTGTTCHDANGMGNIIIGYDEEYEINGNSIPNFCSLGAHTSEEECVAAGGTWATSHKTGSHYLIIGPENNYSGCAGLVAGMHNTSNGNYASVTGGHGNTASVFGASVSGGENNNASGYNASVSGGFYNHASGEASSISGGDHNEATALSSSVSGGRVNTASGENASISGGYTNTASGELSSISGGGGGPQTNGNTASHGLSSILGGANQSTSTELQTIPNLP